MLSPHDLIEVYKIAAMASVFSSADFRKAVEEHVKRFEQIEAQHKANLARQLEVHKNSMEAQRLTVHKEKETWQSVKQVGQEIQEKWVKEQQNIKDQHAKAQAALQERIQETQRREVQLASQEAALARQHTVMLTKEAQLREAAEQLTQERREIQVKLGKLKDLVA